MTTSCIQLWSGKWCIKDEHKLLSDIGTTNGNGGGANGGNGGYYDTHHNGFSSSNIGSTESILYDGITTISQAQCSLYTPPVVTSLGKFIITCVIFC